MNVDACDIDFRTPLWWAQRYDHRAAVVPLCNTGLDRLILDRSNMPISTESFSWASEEPW